MFLKEATSGHLVEVLDIQELMDPHRDTIVGRFHTGEDLPDTECFAKSGLLFPSGEPLPHCWRDTHYRDHEWRR